MQITIQIINQAPRIEAIEDSADRTEHAPIVSLSAEEWTRRGQAVTERAA